MPIRLVATDVDGTLLDGERRVPAGTREALAEARRRGVGLALATVRVRQTARKVADDLGLPCALVCQGGATVYDEGGRLLHAETIPLDLAREVAACADRHGLGLLVTVDEVHHFGPGYETGLPGALERRNVARTNLEAVTAAPTRFMVTGLLGVARIVDGFAGAPLRIVRHYRADGSIIDAAVTAAGATKEAGLAILCEATGVDPSEVLAVGDAESDLGMIRMAGVGVAVANAVPEVLEAADWVAPHAHAGGVGDAVRRFVLGEGSPVDGSRPPR